MRFEVLGPLSVAGEHGSLSITPRKWRALLAILLRYANRPVGVDLLVDALWGERPPRSARANLRVYVHRLRQTLGDEERIAWTGAGYAVTVRPGELDAQHFTELVAQGRKAVEAGDAVAAGAMLREALELWRGSAYEGLADECAPLRDEAARLAELRLTALQERLSLDLDTGRHGEVIPELRALIAEHPLREEFRSQLMIALYRAGRQAEALKVYRESWRLFTAELGIEPSRRLRELEQSILTGDPALQPRADPAAKTLVPQQLPLDVAGFTGRADELAQLDGLLTARDRPVIAALTGPAGVGKTALAVHWARRVRDRFPDGVLFTDLRGYDQAAMPAPPEEVLERFLRALGVPPAAIPAALEERAALLRTRLSDRRMLIVLDNATSSQQARWLLPGFSHCAVVVTSRSRLSGLVARDGARRIPLGLLSATQAVVLLREVMSPDRVDAEPAAAAELARLCANLPLALRLAAERVSARPHLTLADLVRELADEHDRLNLLTADDDDSTAVRAAFSWSYHALPAEAARAFRLLGLHPGPDLSLGAVSALIGADEQRARRLLRTLTAVHLVQDTARDRYQLHDLLRAYARDRAQADEPEHERAAAVRRIFDWYLHTADAADRIFMPHRRHLPLGVPAPAARPRALGSLGGALQWCEEERLNLVAITRYAAETGRHDVAWKLPVALWSYFSICSRWDDWSATHDLGLAAARRGRDGYGESLLLTSSAHLYRDLRRYDEAFDRFHQAIAISRQIGEPWVEAAARTLLGIAHRDRGEFLEGRLHCRQALRLFREQGDTWGTAWALYTLGDICKELRLHGKALEHAEQALLLFDSTEDTWGKSLTRSLLGQICHRLRRYGEATEHCRQALAAAREISSQSYPQVAFYTLGEALALHTLGKIQHDTGEDAAARESWRRALTIFQRLGAPHALTVQARLAELERATS